MLLRKKTAEAKAWHRLMCMSLGIAPAEVVVVDHWPSWCKRGPDTTGVIFFDRDLIVVRLCPDMTDREMVKTVAHETYHLYQVRSGAIRHTRSGWTYKNKRLSSINKMPWSRRPHERAAIRYSNKIADSLDGAQHDKRIPGIKGEPDREPT